MICKYWNLDHLIMSLSVYETYKLAHTYDATDETDVLSANLHGYSKHGYPRQFMWIYHQS